MAALSAAGKEQMNNFRWHRIPDRLHWLCILPAAFTWAFDYCDTQTVCIDPLLVSREYDFFFFRLLETSGGHWWFRLG